MEELASILGGGPSGSVLIPVDLEDSHEHELMRAQRITCGWAAENVPTWRECISRRERSMFWICFPSSSNATQGITTKPDLDYITRAASDGTEERYLAVGHFGLDRTDHISRPFQEGEDRVEHDDSLTSPDGSRLTVASLMILPDFKAHGLGSWAVLRCEDLAKTEEYGSLNCITLTVNTLASRHCMGGLEGPRGMGMFDALGLPVPKRSNVGWFERLGYVKYKEAFRFTVPIPDGEELKCYVAFLEKHLKKEKS